MANALTGKQDALRVSMDALEANIAQLVGEWEPEWRTRLVRQALDPRDFARLREAGYLMVGVPVEFGGLWQSVARSTRFVADMLHKVSRVDPSLALVCAMHPAVLQSSAEQDGGAAQPGWAEQRRWIFETVLDGAFWGTMVSEPGSGGDQANTKAEARLAPDGRYLLSGHKHFGSGSGVTSFMITTARPDAEHNQVTFYMDVRGVPWDGSAGIRLTTPWEGWGMSATQSHAFELSDFPAIRSLRPSNSLPSGFFPCACSSIILGVLERAHETARQDLFPKLNSIRAHERVEWINAEMEIWLVKQALEGMYRALEREDGTALIESLQGKESIAKLAESAMTRICRLIGGATFGKHSPYGYWLENVRALGFLRPPWGMAYDNLFDASWAQPNQRAGW